MPRAKNRRAELLKKYPPTETWDGDPVEEVYYHGKIFVVYTRGAVATALNRKVVTIRSMEMSGVLCHPPITVDKGTKYLRWVYTKDQIKDLVTLAEEEDVLDPSKRNRFSKRFVREAHEIISRKPS